jgi:hypothetical protein
MRALLVGLLLVSGPALAQQGGMADLRVMSGKPLPMPELAAGTVSVRVSNKLPMNAVAGVEVTALFKTNTGEMRKRTARTAADGRAQFDALPAGATFQVEATVEGEKLVSSNFPIPEKGGIRVLLIAGLGAGPVAGEAEPFTLGAVTGKVTAADDLPAGTLELRLHGDDG